MQPDKLSLGRESVNANATVNATKRQESTKTTCFG